MVDSLVRALDRGIDSDERVNYNEESSETSTISSAESGISKGDITVTLRTSGIKEEFQEYVYRR